jgi:hypothetical protein
VHIEWYLSITLRNRFAWVVYLDITPEQLPDGLRDW